MPAKKVAKKVAKKPTPPAKKTTAKKNSQVQYKELHALMLSIMGLEVDDEVTITREWKEGELGYNPAYGNSNDCHLQEGDCGIITKIHDNCIEINDDDVYPIFALRKDEQSNSMRLNEDYTLDFNRDGSIEVGCVEIPFPKLERIYLQAKEKFDNH